MCTVQGGTLERVHQHDCDNKKICNNNILQLNKKNHKKIHNFKNGLDQFLNLTRQKNGKNA